MAAGKNKIERWVQVWVDLTATPVNLTGDVVPGSMSGLGGKTFDEVEMTGISEAMHNFLAGHWSHEFTAQFYMNDATNTGAHSVLTQQEGIVGTLTLMFGAGAAPTTDDPEWEGEYLLAAIPVVLAGNKPVLAARFVPSGAVAPAWGVWSA